MARHRLLTGIALAAGSFAGSLLYRRRTARRRERIDLYYADGSMISLSEGSPGAGPLLALAHDVLHAAG